MSVRWIQFDTHRRWKDLQKNQSRLCGLDWARKHEDEAVGEATQSTIQRFIFSQQNGVYTAALCLSGLLAWQMALPSGLWDLGCMIHTIPSGHQRRKARLLSAWPK
ncbi:hypothetical protein MGG_17770 [Pyricularia oryzae 70-15]|uniref:Uncharacterized protein n=1 Tax=Pyricularia oryzae (strain 70-15 / ATCC MYA-4617 / FGSC 8958) TaxID=242507 RepID=G4NHS1_PYRO7|nr:uncharacterized protein MGG_17770 [Pyricularia oryzae 70-15]EHA47781.1 hypothetical protein MGG_17770 [Pyricularia oryzae 70-15]